MLSLISLFRFDYEYDDIYDDDYWEYNDKLYDSSEELDYSVPKNRKKRSLDDDNRKRSNKKKGKTSLRRTNSASSVLGLNILLYQNIDDYRTINWTGVVQNSFFGFKVHYTFKKNIMIIDIIYVQSFGQ